MQEGPVHGGCCLFNTVTANEVGQVLLPKTVYTASEFTKVMSAVSPACETACALPWPPALLYLHGGRQGRAPSGQDLELMF